MISATNRARVSILAALVAAACNNAPATPAVEGARHPQRFTVNIDGRADSFNAVFMAFFPDNPAVHPGDEVTFRLQTFSGQPHTVTMGTLVDAAAKRLEALGPQASLAAQENSPEMLRLPDVFPHEITGGPQDASQSSGQPCYLDAGVPPLSLTGGAPACPKRDQPAFNGTQSFYNSGVLMHDGDAFSVPISRTTKPGSYSVMCMMHRSAGLGRITVVPSDQVVPGADEVAAEGARQRAHLVDALRPVAEAAQHANGNQVVAGGVAPDVYNALVAEFGPRTIAVPVGSTVTWDVNVFHTISFGAHDDDVGALVKAADGSIHLHVAANAPAGFEVPNAAFAYPPPDDGRPIVIDGGSWDGSGFRSTGLLVSLAPVPVTVKQTFTKAGAYPYRCLFHPAMQGEVLVG
jgi:plastocyanin